VEIQRIQTVQSSKKFIRESAWVFFLQKKEQLPQICGTSKIDQRFVLFFHRKWNNFIKVVLSENRGTTKKFLTNFIFESK
jgi:hypothetical protein